MLSIYTVASSWSSNSITILLCRNLCLANQHTKIIIGNSISHNNILNILLKLCQCLYSAFHIFLNQPYPTVQYCLYLIHYSSPSFSSISANFKTASSSCVNKSSKTSSDIPSGYTWDRSGQSMITEHSLYMQVFDADSLVFAHQHGWLLL